MEADGRSYVQLPEFIAQVDALTKCDYPRLHDFLIGVEAALNFEPELSGVMIGTDRDGVNLWMTGSCVFSADTPPLKVIYSITDRAIYLRGIHTTPIEPNEAVDNDGW